MKVVLLDGGSSLRRVAAALKTMNRSNRFKSVVCLHRRVLRDLWALRGPWSSRSGVACAAGSLGIWWALRGSWPSRWQVCDGSPSTPCFIPRGRPQGQTVVGHDSSDSFGETCLVFVDLSTETTLLQTCLYKCDAAWNLFRGSGVSIEPSSSSSVAPRAAGRNRRVVGPDRLAWRATVADRTCAWPQGRVLES